jgi:hypothetical protein
VRPARWGSGSLRCGIDPGAAPPVCFAAPPLAVFGFAKRSLRSHPRINPSTQPSDVARGSRSRSRAAAELALILEWGGMRRVRVVLIFPVGAAGGCDLLILLLLFCGSWLASDGGLVSDQSLAGVLGSTVGAGLLAKRSVQSADYVELFNSVPNNQNLPTRFSGCPSEARSLVFGCRCQFSDRVWKPDSSRNNAPAP